jgi:hypothetical protein
MSSSTKWPNRGAEPTITDLGPLSVAEAVEAGSPAPRWYLHATYRRLRLRRRPPLTAGATMTTMTPRGVGGGGGGGGGPPRDIRRLRHHLTDQKARPGTAHRP